MHIEIVNHSKGKPIFPERVQDYGFGQRFTDLIFIQNYSAQQGWHGASIGLADVLFPRLHPSAAIFHYGQGIFEGQKAYKTPKGVIQLFRPIENARRFNASADRMAMQTVSEGHQILALTSLLQMQKHWVPPEPDTSLYIRPTMIATDAELGVHPSKTYLYYILLSLAGSYFPQGFSPIKVKVETTMKRAAPGGTGEAKTVGNYAASMLAAKRAEKSGFSQVLWLDSENTHVEEVGAMNIFFVYNRKTLVTPALSGSILPGITRKSILELAAQLGLCAEEKALRIAQVIADIQSGEITEIFGCGTAAVIAPISALGYNYETYVVGDGQIGEVSTLLRETLTGIQYGKIPDPFGWMLAVAQV